MTHLFFQEALENCTFCAIDLETTGLNPGESEILEIAALKFNKNSELGSYNTLTLPEKNLNLEAQKINGITAEMLKEKGVPLDLALKTLWEFCSGSKFVFHNSDFDMSFLDYESKRKNLNIPLSPVFCSLHLSRKVFPNLERHRLSALREHFQISHRLSRSNLSDSYHEALDDCFACKEVFVHCLNKLDSWKSDALNIIVHPENKKLSQDYRFK